MTSKKERNTLAKNMAALLLLQGANYLLPLLTVPFLVRVLGVEHFGLVAFITAIVTYFLIITDYGFNLTVTRTVALCRDDPSQLSKVVSEVFWTRLFLCLVCFVLLTLIIFFVSRFQEHWFAYYLAFGMVVGNALMPVWLFQGLERMGYITALNIGSRCIAVVGIFLLVRQPEDYWLVLLLNTSGYLICGLIAVYIQLFSLKIKLHAPTGVAVLAQLKDGWHVFLSSVSISFYTTSSSVILGLFAGNTAVGYFSAAEKLVSAVKGLSAPVMQAIYPSVNRKMTIDKAEAFRFIARVGAIMMVLMGIISLILIIYAEQVVRLVLGEQYLGSVLLLQLLAITPMIVLLSNLLGVQLMLPLKLNRTYSFIYVIAAVISLVLAVILVSLYAELGTVFTIIVTELLVAVLMAIAVWRYRLRSQVVVG